MRSVTTTLQCPQCGHTRSQKRKRTAWQRLLAVRGAYRCKRCGESYLLIGLPFASTSSKHADTSLLDSGSPTTRNA